MITLAGNGRTASRAEDKTGKTVFAKDFTNVEKVAKELDKKSVELYVMITKEFIVDRDKTGVSLSAWCEEWRKQFPYRAVSTIRGHMTYTVKCADEGYDLSTFQALEHFRQPFTSTRMDRNADKGKVKGMVKQYDSVLSQAKALNKADRKRLALAILAMD